MAIAYSEPLERAFRRMTGMLFRPFDAGKWLALGVGCWMANLSQSGSNSLNFPFEPLGAAVEEAGGDEAFVWLVAGCAFLLFFVLLPLVLWASSRGEFIFLDNVIRDRADVKVPWRRFAKQGNSLFLWRLAFLAVIVLGLVALALPVFYFAEPLFEGAAEPSCLIAVAVMLIFLAVVLAAVFVHMLLVDFVVPFMRRDGLRTNEAWRRFLPTFWDNAWRFVVYALLVVALRIGVAVGTVVLGLATCCVGFIFLAVPYVGTVALLPVFVTFRAFSLEFLAQLGPDLDFFEDMSEVEVFS